MNENKHDHNIFANTMAKAKYFTKKHKALVYIGLFGILIFLPMIFTKSGTHAIFCRILMYSILAGSLNSINGYSGQTCLGQAGFFAIGAYTMAVLATRFGISFWMLIPIAGLFSALVGMLIALPTMRMRGIYLAFVTIGFSEIVRLIALNWMSVTGGPMGIKNIPTPMLFNFKISGPRDFYYIYLMVGALFLFCTDRIIKSRVGRAWMSIREDQQASNSLGVNTTFYKTINFMYGAFWAGVVGCIFASYARYVDSSSFGLDTGWNILSMMVIGGQGTLIGPVVGSVIINTLTEVLRVIGSWRMVIYAVLIIMTMWLRPQGLVGASHSAFNKHMGERAKRSRDKIEVEK